MASAADKYEIQHIIDIPQEMEPAPWRECCIYKVPSTLRNLKEKEVAYTPQLIAIGPLHRHNQELKPMEEQKHRYFHFFWDRLPNKQVLVKYKSFLHQNEEKIRRCYAEKFPHVEKDEFVGMILLDSVFIVELFLRDSERWKYKGDHVLTQSWLSKGIQRDLLLLENQLPMCLLEELYDSVVPDDMKVHITFCSLAHDYFASYYPTFKISSPDKAFRLKNWEKSIHFTDLIRCSYLPMDYEKHEMGPNTNPGSNSRQRESVLRTATKLNEAGVTFEKVRNRSLLDIKFVKNRYLSWFLCLGCLPYTNIFKARFQLPQLKVQNTTECVLRNLIALEECHYPEEPFICNYVSLIDSLIHTKDDVELLVENEAIVHELGSDKELATLVNGLCKHVSVTGSSTNYYRETIQDLNKHYNSKWKRAMGTLKWVYFRDPWRSSSTVVGIAVLIFAIFNFCRVIKVVI